MAGLEPVGFLAKFRNLLVLSGPSTWLEQKLIGGQTAAINATEAVKEAAQATGSAITFGTKYGLIIFFIILALFVMAQAKTLTAAFKE